MRFHSWVAFFVIGGIIPQPAQSLQEIADRGDFTLRFSEGANELENALRGYLSETGLLQALVDDVNSEINLAFPVEIIFAPAQAIIAEWNLAQDDTTIAGYQDQKIQISYGNIIATMHLFDANDDLEDSEEDFIAKILPNIGETMLHEIGHALVHVNRIPISGENPEVVADQLAFFIVSDFYDAPEDFIPVVNQYLYRQAAGNSAGGDSPHPPDVARAQNYMCWVYGYNPELFAFLGEYVQGDLESCEDAYFELWASWEDRLDPSWKESAEPDPEELFYYLIDEEDYTLDAAILEIAEVNDLTVAVDLAVYLCAPEADPECAGSEVLSTWEAFMASVGETGSVMATVSQLADLDYDEFLLEGIAVYWCSPEPGPGCSAAEDPYSLTWEAFDIALANSDGPAEAIEAISADYDPFIVELIGVYLCGHPACYLGEQISLGEQAGVSSEPLRPSGLKRKTTGRRRSSRPARSARPRKPRR